MGRESIRRSRPDIGVTPSNSSETCPSRHRESARSSHSAWTKGCVCELEENRECAINTLPSSPACPGDLLFAAPCAKCPSLLFKRPTAHFPDVSHIIFLHRTYDLNLSRPLASGLLYRLPHNVQHTLWMTERTWSRCLDLL